MCRSWRCPSRGERTGAIPVSGGSPSRRGMPGRTPVIAVSNLGRRYGRTVAVDDVSLEVLEGEIFGLIGPNGAGKTTTMECVQGHRIPDKGTISVLGLDPQRDAN